jgi:hypothetical protein
MDIKTYQNSFGSTDVAIRGFKLTTLSVSEIEMLRQMGAVLIIIARHHIDSSFAPSIILSGFPGLTQIVRGARKLSA